MRTGILLAVVAFGSYQLIADRAWSPVAVLVGDAVAAAALTVIVATRWTRAR